MPDNKPKSRVEIVENFLRRNYKSSKIVANMLANSLLDELDAFAEQVENEKKKLKIMMKVN